MKDNKLVDEIWKLYKLGGLTLVECAIQKTRANERAKCEKGFNCLACGKEYSAVVCIDCFNQKFTDLKKKIEKLKKDALYPDQYDDVLKLLDKEMK